MADINIVVLVKLEFFSISLFIQVTIVYTGNYRPTLLKLSGSPVDVP